MGRHRRWAVCSALSLFVACSGSGPAPAPAPAPASTPPAPAPEPPEPPEPPADDTDEGLTFALHQGAERAPVSSKGAPAAAALPLDDAATEKILARLAPLQIGRAHV